jgi:tetratricopeptide (TPR) repeat protein
MNVLCHGHSWNVFAGPDVFIEAYQGGHDIRRLGIDAAARYRYDPLDDTALSIIDRISREWRPDVLLCWYPEEHPPPQNIEDAPVTTVALPSDWNVTYARLALNLARYDHVFCDGPGVEVLRNRLVSPEQVCPRYLPVPDINHPYPGERDIDLLYAGSWNYARNFERARCLERLAALSSTYRVVFTSCPPGEPYARLCARSRMVFNYSVRGEVNQRVIETFASGALALLEDGNAEAHELFDGGRDLVFYQPENPEETVRHYLERPDEAAAIAARGLERENKFTVDAQFDRLIGRVASAPADGRRFHALPPEEQAHQTALMYAVRGRPEYHALIDTIGVGLVKDYSNDPRTWAMLGAFLLDPTRRMDNAEDRYTKAFMQAHRLAPRAAPHALNLATILNRRGLREAEAECLHAVLDGDSLDGAGLLIEAHTERFWHRWQDALAHQRESLVMLRAEARVRLASFFAEHGRLDEAKSHLAEAAVEDPDNHGGEPLLAEILWRTGARDKAIAVLRRHLPFCPFDIGRRQRFAEMLVEAGRAEEARYVTAATMCLLNATAEGVPE